MSSNNRETPQTDTAGTNTNAETNASGSVTYTNPDLQRSMSQATTGIFNELGRMMPGATADEKLDATSATLREELTRRGIEYD
ncbi:hypothetical protein IAT38_006884 [Cryptococcus sp. DSM 104549]